MIRKTIWTIIILLTICLPQHLMADMEYSVKLSSAPDSCYKSVKIGQLMYISFSFERREGNNAKILVSIDNTTQDPPHAIVLFKNNETEKSLKKGKPKIEFDKVYGGEKGKRSVEGIYRLNNGIEIITAGETDTIMSMEVPLGKSNVIDMPFYEATYKAKDFYKKGKFNTKFKILERINCRINLEVEGWTINDSTYSRFRDEVKAFKESLNGMKFCPNGKHRPSLREQQRKFKERKEVLTHQVDSAFAEIKKDNYMTDELPYQSYNALLKDLKSIDLDDYKKDCGKHKETPPPPHTCKYCSSSAKSKYYLLDNLYQGMRAGRISKSEAVKTAKAIYKCYTLNKEGGMYGEKVVKFYNRILSY